MRHRREACAWSQDREEERRRKRGGGRWVRSEGGWEPREDFEQKGHRI